MSEKSNLENNFDKVTLFLKLNSLDKAKRIFKNFPVTGKIARRDHFLRILNLNKMLVLFPVIPEKRVFLLQEVIF